MIALLISIIIICVLIAVFRPSLTYPSIEELTKQTNVNPIKNPIPSSFKQAKTTSRIITYKNRYTQHQKFLNGKWVLHNLNGPAVIDSKENKEYFFIDGIQYENELQYLVKKTY